MNAFAKRMREHRERVAKARRARLDMARADRFVQVDAQLNFYEEAYRAANNGRRCHLIYRGGWVLCAESVTFRVRLAQLQQLANELYATVHDVELDAPD